LGPALNSPAKWISFLGVKGGVGCSVLAALLARRSAKDQPRRIALVDALSPSFSMLPALLSIRSNCRTLDQLTPYQERLSASLVESFFSTSPEGVSLIPTASSAGSSDPQQVIALLEKLSPWLSELWFDL